MAETSGQAGDVGATGDPTRQEPPSAMAHVMADMTDVWHRLLEDHVPDRLGRCRGCRSDTGSGERWPCSLHRIATQARRVHEQNLAQATETDREA